jgi:hypothetical protein
MKIHTLRLRLLKLLLAKLNRILVMHSGVKEGGYSPGAVIFVRWEMVNINLKNVFS